MNLSRGLQRVSAVFFGVIALLVGIACMVNLDKNGAAFLLILPVIYALHRVFCWVIKGFFGDG
jgi:uncharacterized membrane protein HdeD (DUF308 family)